MNVAIITSGYLPVPPTKGGAVENIIYNLVKKNEIYGECHFTIYSIDDNSNENFKNSTIKYVKTSSASRLLDNCLYFVAKNILHRGHLISYRYFFQRMEFLSRVGKDLSDGSFDKILLENNVVMFRTLEKNNNFNKYKGKIYYHAHNELGKTLGYDKYLKKLTKVITVSDYIKECYKEYIPGSEVKFETVHNSIDESCFKNELSNYDCLTLRNQMGIKNEYPIILFAGRISEEKGITELFEALSKIDNDRYNLLIVGKSFFGTGISDAFEDNLKTLATKIKGNVVFTGMVKYTDMYKYYKLADLCVLPSVWNEPCALTVIECIICGTPLITTDTGGTPENITDSTIMISTDRIVEQLAAEIRTLLDNPEKLKLLKLNSKKEIYKHGTLDDYYKNFMRALDI